MITPSPGLRARHRRAPAVLTAALTALLLGTTGAASAATVTPTAIPSAPLGAISPQAISASGQIVGHASFAEAFSFTRAGGLVQLPKLAPVDVRAIALGVSDTGVVVGEGQPPGPGPTHAVLWSAGGQITDIGALLPNPDTQFSRAPRVSRDGTKVLVTLFGPSNFGGYLYSAATGPVPIPAGPAGTNQAFVAVNNSGQVVVNTSDASVTTSTVPRGAAVWTAAGGMVDLPTSSGLAPAATAQNNAGQVVGALHDPTTGLAVAGFTWSATGGLVRLPGPARDVTGSGLVLGERAGADGPHILTWTAGGGAVDLPVAGCTTPIDISEQGQVLGQTVTPCGAVPAGPATVFTWTAGGGVLELGPLGIEPFSALALSDNGLVVGTTFRPRGQSTGIIWDTAVPPPWVFGGFLGPIAAPPAFNEIEAGERVPVRFRITDGAGAPVTTLEQVRVSLTPIACVKKPKPKEIDSTDRPAGLRNLGGGLYEFVWQTSRASRRTCATAAFDLGRAGVQKILVSFSN